jgi:hypothetical protein
MSSPTGTWYLNAPENQSRVSVSEDTSPPDTDEKPALINDPVL